MNLLIVFASNPLMLTLIRRLPPRYYAEIGWSNITD